MTIPLFFIASALFIIGLVLVLFDEWQDWPRFVADSHEKWERQRELMRLDTQSLPSMPTMEMYNLADPFRTQPHGVTRPGILPVRRSRKLHKIVLVRG